MISKEKIYVNEIMVSFDMKPLFMNVPIPEALNVIQEVIKNGRLNVRKTLNTGEMSNLLKVCLKTIYFVFNEEYY